MSQSRPSSSSRDDKASKPKETKQLGLAQRVATSLQSGSEKIEKAIGIDTNRAQQARAQKRRDSLKRKIKVVSQKESDYANGGSWA